MHMLQCAPNYYKMGDTCEPCGDSQATLLLYAATGTFLAVFTLAVFFLPYEAFNSILGVVAALQDLRGLGQMASSELPIFIRKVCPETRIWRLIMPSAAGGGALQDLRGWGRW